MFVLQATSSAGETGEAEGSTSESQNSSPHNTPNKTSIGQYLQKKLYLFPLKKINLCFCCLCIFLSLVLK